jgi:hypothetical protein
LFTSFFGVCSGGWTITGTAFDLRDPRILAVAQNHIMEAEYDDYSATNASTAAFCRSAALLVSSYTTYVFTLIEHVTKMLIPYVFTFPVCAVNGSPIIEACIDSN